MVEKNFQTMFSRWIKYNLIGSGLFELKITKTKSIAFNRLEPHQKQNLLQAKHGQVCYKPPDVGFQNPCDVICVKGGYGNVYVMYYTERGTKHFYEIDIDIWDNEEKTSPRKSLTEDRAKEIATRACYLR